MITLDLVLEYPDRRTAENIYYAILPDNEGYVRAEVRENTIHLEVSSESAGSMRNTADDLLACVKIAEEAAGLVSGAHIEEEEDEGAYE